MDLDGLLSGIADSGIAFAITDPRRPDNPLVAVNEAFSHLTGYEAGESIGRNPRFLQGPMSEEAARAVVRHAVAAHQPAITEIWNYRRDGSAFRNAMMVAPVFGDDGELAFYLGSQVDVGLVAAEGRRETARRLVAQLTPRRREILWGLASGHRNRQIAERLGLAVETVKMHRAAMLQSLGVGSVAEAIRLAVEAAIV
ncbi:MAG: hypothetical protein QOH47_2386 [Sphingomonadales bacterium]|jgi:PAS domain S-box-containing protein|nr:hypothetical protein [Sphingomonadales bacterium]